MWWINLVILGLAAWAAFIGRRRGGVAVAAELMGYLVAIAVASLTYRPVGSWIAGHLGWPASFAAVTAYATLAVAAEIAYVLAAHRLFAYLARRYARTPANVAAGIILGLAKGIVLITLGLIVFAGLPLNASQKEVITNAYIPRHLLVLSGGWQQSVSQEVSGSLTDALNFFTVKPDPESTERIELGFKTTAVRVDAYDEQRMLALVNQERTSRGLRPLVMNDKAQAVARAYSRTMFAEGYFSHIDNQGHNPFDRMRAGGVSFGSAGENLALAPTLQLAHNGLMNSPGHRANILSPDYRTVGIGIIDGGRYGLMITQDFTD